MKTTPYLIKKNNNNKKKCCMKLIILLQFTLNIKKNISKERAK